MCSTEERRQRNVQVHSMEIVNLYQEGPYALLCVRSYSDQSFIKILLELYEICLCPHSSLYRQILI